MKKLFFSLCTAALLAGCSSSDDDFFAPEAPRVVAYCPAPGQFINEGDMASCRTAAEAVAYAQRRIDAGAYVSLGAFGGYLTFEIPAGIANREGYDFGIAGNAFAGSSEPGIVWVSADGTKWYELKGSDTPTRGYTVTYTRLDAPAAIPWTDNRGGSGEVMYQPAYHAQLYYPAWEGATLVRSGSLLPHRTELEGTEWHNKAFNWGYVDNMGSDAMLDGAGNYLYNRFELDNAIDADGAPVALTNVRYVKIQSAILHGQAPIGEVSTEVCGLRLF